MIQVEETNLLPMHQDLKKDLGLLRSEMDLRFGYLRSEIDVRFNSIQSEMNVRFEKIDSRFDYLIRFIALLAVPIIGSTIGGLGVIFLKIYETLR